MIENSRKDGLLWTRWMGRESAGRWSAVFWYLVWCCAILRIPRQKRWVSRSQYMLQQGQTDRSTRSLWQTGCRIPVLPEVLWRTARIWRISRMWKVMRHLTSPVLRCSGIWMERIFIIRERQQKNFLSVYG